MPPPPQPPPPGDRKEGGGAPKPPAAVWNKGAEGIFFLTPHFEEKFYFSAGPFDVILKANNDAYAKDVAFLLKSRKLLADPAAGLESKAESDRLLTAWLTLMQFNAYKPAIHGPTPQREPADAKISRRILEVLLEADWTKHDPDTQMSAANLFWQLGIGPGDGWNPPAQGFKNQKELETAGKAWLKENLDKFKVQRFAPAKKAG